MEIDRIRRAGIHMMGRVTYEEMASAWPTSTADYAAPMNEIPKVVFSKTLTNAPWPESTIARGDLADEVARLKGQTGGEIIAWGGASFVQSLSRAGLIDEYAIVIQPVVYGGGLPISPTSRTRCIWSAWRRPRTPPEQRSTFLSPVAGVMGSSREIGGSRAPRCRAR